jgi:hypothetical protein
MQLPGGPITRSQRIWPRHNPRRRLLDREIGDHPLRGKDLGVARAVRTSSNAGNEPVCPSQSHRSGSESVHIGGTPAVGFGLL